MGRHTSYLVIAAGLSLAFLTSCEQISKSLGLNVNSPETSAANVLYAWVDDAPRGSGDRDMGVIDAYTLTVRIGNPSNYAPGKGPTQSDTSTVIETVRLLGIKPMERPDIFPFGAKQTMDYPFGQPESTAEYYYDHNLWQDPTGARGYVLKNVWHKWIKLEFDSLMRDGKGRLLAYVYADSSSNYSTFINAELLRAGQARLYINSPNYRYSTYFRQLQQQAQVNKLGIWAQ